MEVVNFLGFNLTIEELRKFQAYGYFILITFLVVVLYSYIFYIYRNQKKGVRDYEKYSRLALDDSIESEPIEPKKGEER